MAARRDFLKLSVAATLLSQLPHAFAQVRDEWAQGFDDALKLEGWFKAFRTA